MHTAPRTEHVVEQASFSRPQVMPEHAPFWHTLSGPTQPSRLVAVGAQHAWPGWPHFAQVLWRSALDAARAEALLMSARSRDDVARLRDLLVGHFSGMGNAPLAGPGWP
jgi:hypothetical protein